MPVYTDILNLPPQADSGMSNTEDASPEGWFLARKRQEKKINEPS